MQFAEPHSAYDVSAKVFRYDDYRRIKIYLAAIEFIF